jgi:hypothetical protein
MASNFLKCLCKTKDGLQLKKVLKKASPEDMKCLVNTVTDVMKKKIPISKHYAKIIVKNRKMLRHLVHPSFSIKSKKRYMVQHGGGLAAALARIAKVGFRLASNIGQHAAKPLRRVASEGSIRSLTPSFTRSLERIAKPAAKVVGQRGALHKIAKSPVGKAASVATWPVRHAYRWGKAHNNPRYHMMGDIGAEGAVESMSKTKLFRTPKSASLHDLSMMEVTDPRLIPKSIPVQKHVSETSNIFKRLIFL